MNSFAFIPGSNLFVRNQVNKDWNKIFFQSKKMFILAITFYPLISFPVTQKENNNLLISSRPS